MTHSTLRRRLRAAAALATTLALAALGAFVPTGAQAAVTGDAIKVVQLGDSYSAGNGAGDYYGPSDCYRSHKSWAADYADWLSDGGHHVTFLTRACSGGVSKDLREPRRMDTRVVDALRYASEATPEDALARARADKVCTTRYPDEEYFDYRVAMWQQYTAFAVECTRWLKPQMDAVGKDTDLVVLTLGGNDLGFADIVKECFALGFRDPGSCREKVARARDGADDLQVSIVDVLAKLRAKMRPDARVVLLGYPYLSNRTSFVLRSLKDRLPWVEGDSYDIGKEVRALGDEGDDLQRDAVAAANRAAGTSFVTYVDGVKPLFAGHEPDPSTASRNPDRWIHEFDTFTQAEWYHPTERGHLEESSLLHGIEPGGRVPSAGAGSIDLVFAIDTTGSMGGVIDAVKAMTTRMVDQLAAGTGSYRFALVTYGDDPRWTGDMSDYTSRVELGFTTDPDEIRAALASLYASGGGDWPESALSGLDAAISLPWRPGVKKVLIPIGDAPGHDPEPYTGLSSAQIIAKALAVDPVEVYPVSVSGDALSVSLQTIADGTGGFTTISDGDVAQTLLDTVTSAMDKPYAWLDGPYVARVGDALTLDARGSYATTGTLVTYEWDLDGDGTYDVTTTDPQLTHTFAAPVDGYLAVRVTDDTGRASIATTVLVVSDDGDEIARDEDVCPDVADPGQEDSDADGLGDVCDPDPYPVPAATDTVVFEADAPGTLAGSAITGSVFVDADEDGARDASEDGVPGTPLSLTGTDAGGEPVTASTTTAADGTWTFDGLLPGRYTVVADATTTAVAVGTLAGAADGSSGGTLAANAVADVVLAGTGARADGLAFATAPVDGAVPTPSGSPTAGGAAPVDPTVAPAAHVVTAPAAPSSTAPLAATGVDVLALAPWVGGLMALGALMMVLAAQAGRRRRHPED